MDTVTGRPSGPVPVTMVDRVNKNPFISLAASKTADDVNSVIYELFKDCKGGVETATYDNGKDFPSHEMLNEILGIDSYFTRPYTWEALVSLKISFEIFNRESQLNFASLSLAKES